MIKSIDIQNFGSFKNFVWRDFVRNNGNVLEFKRLNILYGRNYSGKTTLSRIFRSFETGAISEKYKNAKFKLSHAGNELLTHSTIGNNPYHIRVYNKDFVKDNLKWLLDEDEIKGCDEKNIICSISFFCSHFVS